ncbi:hypothetical protein AZE42_01529 [Rhizopogon vesiculosus]|uniref:Autophagy-related protein 13 n=1 Tax=Rhizopogon vesiculosus TaxID=180088 RepID=A0A1J8PZ86_9AGAM|nr:hypothetical protein AZE42_01529 [Rhizopogon vesiculosus]
MSNGIQKADQVAYRFYVKLCLVVSNARATSSDPRSQQRVDEWFNLETPDSALFKDHLRMYRAVSTAPVPPPFELQVLLSVPDLAANQFLVHGVHDSSPSCLRVDSTLTHIVLESWLLHFIPREVRGDPDSVAPSTMYNLGIPLFRSIYSLLRILPSWQIYNKLRSRTRTDGDFGIHLHIKGLDDGNETNSVNFASPSNAVTPAAPLHNTHIFPTIPHPLGVLALSVTYLSSQNFRFDELNSLLFRYLSLDRESEYIHTLSKNRQRDSSQQERLVDYRRTQPIPPKEFTLTLTENGQSFPRRRTAVHDLAELPNGKPTLGVVPEQGPVIDYQRVLPIPILRFKGGSHEGSNRSHTFASFSVGSFLLSTNIDLTRALFLQIPSTASYTLED